MTGRRNRTPTRTTTLRHRQRHLSLFMSSSSSSSTTHCLLLSKISCLLCVCVCSFLNFVSLCLRWMCCCHSLQQFLLWDKQKSRSYNQAPNLHSHLCKELLPKELKHVITTHKQIHNLSLSLSLSLHRIFLSLSHTHTHSLSLPLWRQMLIAFFVLQFWLSLWIGKKASLFLLVTTTSIRKWQITNARTVPLWMIR